MTDFCKQALFFEWEKGNNKYGAARTKSHWVEKYRAMVNLSDNQLSTADEKSILNHRIQSSMNLKPALNCERAWIYRLKGDDGVETTLALRFKTKYLAREFHNSFVRSVDAVKALEESHQHNKEIEDLRELIEITAKTRNVDNLVFRPDKIQNCIPSGSTTETIEKRHEQSIRSLVQCQIDMTNFYAKLITDRLSEYTGVVFEIENDHDINNESQKVPGSLPVYRPQ